MDSMEVHRLRHHELRLLRCSLPSSPPPISLQPHPSPPSNQTLLLLDSITALIESGLYLESLSSAASRAVFQSANSFESTDPAEFYDGLEKAVESYLVDEDDDSDASSRVLIVVSIAVAALLAFVQCNFIGPVIELPLTPLPWKVLNEGKEWEAWARIQLMEGGSDLAAKLSNLQYIFFAKILLTKSRDLLFSEKAKAAVGFGTISWWLARLLLLQQRILDEHCSSLLDLLQVLVGESLNCFGDVQKVASYWRALLDEEEAFSIVSALQLEVGMIEHTFGRVDHAKRHFESATSAVGLELSVTGALGFRTVHQVDPKAQMVLVANRSSLPSASSSQTGGPLHQREASISEENGYQNREKIKESSESLMTPRITDDAENKMDGKNVNQNGHNTKVILTEIQQAVVLAQCLLLEKSARLDELQRWEMAPYIEAIDSQPSSYFSIKCSCNILRIRWESTRSRTMERALLMMDKAVHDLYEAAPQVSERVHSFFGVFIPAVPLLRKEYGELLVSRGLVGEALKIFEELELWDNLIFCYRSLEKKAAAVELIKMRLLELPNDPRLWCSLGDVTIDDACYEKALEVSKNRSSRAKRSLARSAYNRGDYERSKVLWESAMALNSLYPDGWFALGAAALKARDINKALDGFTRAVQLDPDNGEAWNNIACLHMIRKKSEAAFIAFKEALKLKRNSWQMWENYGEVAADVGNFAQAIEAAKMVFDLSGNKKYDGELLERIMQELERRTSCQSSSISSSDNEVSGSDSANLRQTERLMESFGRVLQQIVRSIGGDVWGIYARWHKLRGDLTMCSEALLKQIRSYQGSEVWKDIARFRKLANASLELCKIYIEISSSTGSVRELHAAGMHLRNTIKQASAFSEAEEYKALQVCLAEVQANLESNSLPT